MSLPPSPKFVKVYHHIVPKFWQTHFAAPGEVGPYYKNIKTGRCTGPEGPGNKMSAHLANIVFDEYYRPSDALEDRLSVVEANLAKGLHHLEHSRALNSDTQQLVALLLAVQACRYPEEFQRRFDLGKYLAVVFKDIRYCADATSFNSELTRRGMSVEISTAEFERLKSASDAAVESELESILGKHGYEADFNPDLILAGAIPTAELMLQMSWKLLLIDSPELVLSDHPVPAVLSERVAVPLTGSIGLILEATTHGSKNNVESAKATVHDVEAINAEVIGRAVEWICGPRPFVQSL